MKVAINGKVVDMDIEETALEIPAEYKIQELKQKLADTDYKAIKYAEGEITAEEYAETKAQRKAWRSEINALEAELKTL